VRCRYTHAKCQKDAFKHPSAVSSQPHSLIEQTDSSQRLPRTQLSGFYQIRTNTTSAHSNTASDLPKNTRTHLPNQRNLHQTLRCILPLPLNHPLPDLTPQRLRTLPRRIKPTSLELARLARLRIRINIPITIRMHKRRVDLFAAAGVAWSASVDVSLRLGWRMVDIGRSVDGESDVALTTSPARQSGGRDVVAVWAGAGLEEDRGVAEGEVGVDGAGGVLVEGVSLGWRFGFGVSGVSVE
jgi:hypothetical protein